ncbi:MAG: SDR family oxidoreductase [Oscillochloris sp.]|nr:SDR family oxidoreductase [Oscillochloris sp.]
MQLTGTVALVTGGGRGLGRAMALSLARAGALVAVTARSADEVAETAWLIDDLGGRSLGIAADVREAAQVQEVVAQVGEQLGPIGILVTSAGVGLRAPLQETSANQWDAIYDTLVKGTFLAAQAVIPQMTSRGGGNIITIGAPLERIGVPGFAAYYSAKCAVDGLTRVMAKDLRRYGINVNCLHPGGFVDTAMVRSTVPEITTGLLGTDEIAAAVLELALLSPRSQSGATIDAHRPKSVQNSH